MAIFNFAALSIDPTLNDSATMPAKEKSDGHHRVVEFLFSLTVLMQKIDRRKKDQ